jgi:hypothetical protein
MKLAIIGSRTFDNYELLKKSINENFGIKTITTIVSGGAKGADTLAEQFAVEYKLQKNIILPDWAKHGKKAAFLRNYDIIDAADSVIAFWDESSKGTKHAIDYAKKINKSCIIVCYEKS